MTGLRSRMAPLQDPALGVCKPQPFLHNLSEQRRVSRNTLVSASSHTQRVSLRIKYYSPFPCCNSRLILDVGEFSSKISRCLLGTIFCVPLRVLILNLGTYHAENNKTEIRNNYSFGMRMIPFELLTRIRAQSRQTTK